MYLLIEEKSKEEHYLSTLPEFYMSMRKGIISLWNVMGCYIELPIFIYCLKLTFLEIPHRKSGCLVWLREFLGVQKTLRHSTGYVLVPNLLI